MIGFSIFLSILGFMIYIAIKEKNLLYGLFILMMFVFFMFESILNRLAGVSFFSLFLLYYYKCHKIKCSPVNPRNPGFKSFIAGTCLTLVSNLLPVKSQGFLQHSAKIEEIFICREICMPVWRQINYRLEILQLTNQVF